METTKQTAVGIAHSRFFAAHERLTLALPNKFLADAMLRTFRVSPQPRVLAVLDRVSRASRASDEYLRSSRTGHMRSVVQKRFGAHNRTRGSRLASLYGRALLRPSQLSAVLDSLHGTEHARAASHIGRVMLLQRRRWRASLVTLLSVAVSTAAGYGTVARLTGPPPARHALAA